jgi:hypothetical protein
MKYYALLHGVCGLAEGYSDTTVRWFNDLDKALESKARLRAALMDDDNAESCTTTTDGMQSVINYDIDEREHEIVKIIEVKPTWPENKNICEYLVWDQMNCEAPFDGDYLPTDMAVIKDLCERQEAVADTFDVEAFHEFVNDLWYGGAAMFDADDLCIYYFKMPKVYYPSQPVEFKS